MKADSQRPSELSVEEARDRLRRMIPSIAELEQVGIGNAFKRVLANDLRSPINVPSFRNSAMDGFAVRHADLSAVSPQSMFIAGSAFAGRPFAGSLAPGVAIRIMTGAPLPDELDTVVPQEVCVVAGSDVVIPNGQHMGQHCRAAGEDIAAGSTVLPAGQLISAADMGLLASLGISSVEVRRKPRIGVFSTGDELLALGSPPVSGKIYDSNRFVLISLLADLGLEAEDMGIIPDHPDALEKAFRYGSQLDLVISSGGVSVGEADFTRTLLNRLGSVSFHSLAVRPGRPLAFGRIGDAWYFGLPGNPVAAMVTFLFVVRDAIFQLMGAEAPELIQIPAISAGTVKKRKGRTEYQRGIARTGADGQLSVALTGAQGSGILSSMSVANCMMVLDPETDTLSPGDPVPIIPFRGLLGV